MKQIITLIVVFIALQLRASNLPILDQPKVDERVELLSIVFRLAECDEYSSMKNKAYADRINSYFNLYKDHPLIKYTRKIRRYGIGYDAVMQMAIHIGEAPAFLPLKEFDQETPESRWGKKRATKFLKLLRRFYQEAECQKFFESEKVYYQEVVDAFMPIYEQLDLDWYTSFYGQDPTEKFVTIVAPGNAGSNYGPHLSKNNGEKEIYAILGVWKTDEENPVIYSVDQYFPILLHEFNHSFVNPVMEEYRKELAPSGTSLYQTVSAKMQAQAYGEWEVMLIESVVRASVIHYMMDHQYPTERIEEEMTKQIDKGFIWMEYLLFRLEEYKTNREAYPSLRSFMPELVQTFETIQQNFTEANGVK